MLDLKWVYVGGTFDCFHVGHVRLLYAASQRGNVVASLNTDEFAERYKRRPVHSLSERLEIMEACVHVEMTTVNKGDEDSKVTLQWLIDHGYDIGYVAHGDDWAGDSLKQQMGVTDAWLQERDISMLYLPYTKGVSTTEILERCLTAA